MSNRMGKKTSPLWSYFTEADENLKAKCNFCSQFLSIKGGFTFNLSRHLKNKHFHAYNSLKETAGDAPMEDDSPEARVVEVSQPIPSTSSQSETNSDITYKCYLLDCLNYSESHSADNLATLLRSVAEEWKIGNKIEAVVTDNAANVVAAIRKTEWKHVPCFAHTLNLVVQNALEQIKTVQVKVKHIVEHFKRSPKATTFLKSMQKQMGLPILGLKQDVITRWNSTYDMFYRILETKDALLSTIAIHYPNVDTLTSDDIVTLQKCCEVLDVFKTATEEMSSETQVTASKIILISSGLKQYCSSYLQANSDLPSTVRQMVEILITSLGKRFYNIEQNKIFAEATFLDPRFKKHGFTNSSNFDVAKNNITRYLTNFNEEDTQTENAAKTIEESKTTEPTQKCLSKIWESFDQKVSNLIGTTNPKFACMIEIDKYLQEPLLQRTENPLKWWQERKSIYPRLYQLAVKKLCVVATSVPSERIFSKAGQTVTDRRNRLSGEKVRQLVFLNVNLN
ncbi:unnamed protein product [Brassicogethes aeneus]|uniref:BED-type domain-containing protein n=1 Tax=Brassicogethes aeneus TaxID=1431903 RepID=A0A9P0FM99_BRAAE|nr:unnamed protein product [Brassicogethes aeneus]